MLKKIRNYLITGLVVILPTGLTLYLLWWLFQFVDGLAGNYVAFYLGYRIPGLGILIIFLLLLGAGLLTQNILGRYLLGIWEKLIAHIPLVNSVYNTIKQTLEIIWQQEQEREKGFQRVVLFEYPRKGSYALGFVTGEAKGEVQLKTKERVLNVFLPTTPNPTSGYLLLIPARDVIPLEMTVEDGLKMIISGGFVTPKYEEPGGEITPRLMEGTGRGKDKWNQVTF